jgi:hypothetical protein
MTESQLPAAAAAQKFGTLIPNRIFGELPIVRCRHVLTAFSLPLCHIPDKTKIWDNHITNLLLLLLAAVRSLFLSPFSRRNKVINQHHSKGNILATKLSQISLSFSLARAYFSAETTESELCRVFSAYGNVKSTKIIVDRAGVSKGYGFVTFETELEASRLHDVSETILSCMPNINAQLSCVLLGSLRDST